MPRPPHRANDTVVRIRPYEADDVLAHLEAVQASLPALMAWLPWPHAEWSAKDSLEWVLSRPPAWQNGTSYCFVIENVQTGAFLGDIALMNLDERHRLGEIGYWMRSDQSGQGYARRAVKLVRQFGFRTLGLQRIEILVEPHNHASRRVAEAAGAVEEGLLRRRLGGQPKNRDAVLYALVDPRLDEG